MTKVEAIPVWISVLCTETWHGVGLIVSYLLCLVSASSECILVVVFSHSFRTGCERRQIGAD